MKVTVSSAQGKGKIKYDPDKLYVKKPGTANSFFIPLAKAEFWCFVLFLAISMY